MPANRGIVSSGLYRAVRHPIYAGYLVTHLAFLVANPSARNIAVLVAADVALVVRSLYEERTLRRDEGYGAYCRMVRWRLVPRVF
jgi:protein-S-isoprenylcysteine O-methyltransferase Ste14